MDDVSWCYAVLTKVSRSFAVVIQQLPDEMKDAIMIFYLVLRGLDSVEDDMTVCSIFFAVSVCWCFLCSFCLCICANNSDLAGQEASVAA